MFLLMNGKLELLNNTVIHNRIEVHFDEIQKGREWFMAQVQTLEGV